MHKSDDTSGYPLSPTLTLRLVNYLNGFRLFISLTLAAAYVGGILVQAQAFAEPVAPTVLLSIYVALAIAFLYFASRPGANPFHLAFLALLTDVGLVTLLLMTFGGLSSGLGVLLLFISASAAVLLPLREALFITALATIALVGEAVIGGYPDPGGMKHLLRSGLYGLTLFIITLLAHALANWARDFRLIAERQALTLTRLEQINELIIKRMRSGVMAVDDTGRIRMMNESAWYLLGSPPVADDMLVDLSPELLEALQAWKDDPGTDSGAVTLDLSQAQVIPKFVALPAGREISTLVFLEDNDVVSQRARELSSTSLAKLSTSIAHEIRNPLAAITHAAQLLGESRSLEAADARMVDIIAKQSRRMNGIVENILQIARREKSRPEALDLGHWLPEVAEEFRGAHPAPRLELEVDQAPGNPYVLFDPSQLHQVIWKLLENASQHAGKEGEAPRISLQLNQDRPNDGFCILSVEDNGMGIRTDQVGQIFEPFFTTRREGSGLGLYIARQLCEANQAELTVDSAPGHYARFQIRMALASGPSQAGGLPYAANDQR